MKWLRIYRRSDGRNPPITPGCDAAGSNDPAPLGLKFDLLWGVFIPICIRMLQNKAQIV